MLPAHTHTPTGAMSLFLPQGGPPITRGHSCSQTEKLDSMRQSDRLKVTQQGVGGPGRPSSIASWWTLGLSEDVPEGPQPP